MRNLSCRLSFSTAIDGSELRIGLKKGSGSLNRGNRGSLLNSDLFKYASPMDLETCKRGKNLHQINGLLLSSPTIYNSKIGAHGKGSHMSVGESH